MTIGQDGTMLIDCCVRLRNEELREVRLQHLQSGVDADGKVESASRSFAATSVLPRISGYTEWVTDSNPVVSIGWDWTLDSCGELVLDGLSIRTNVMLVDEHGRDLGREMTLRSLIGIIGLHAWQPAVLTAVQASGRDAG